MKTHYLSGRISIYRIPFRLGFLLVIKPAIEMVFWVGIYQITIVLQRTAWNILITKTIKSYLMTDGGAFIELGRSGKNGLAKALHHVKSLHKGANNVTNNCVPRRGIR